MANAHRATRLLCAWIPLFLIAACSSSNNGGSPSGTTGPSGGTLCYSCTNPVGPLAASATPACVNYYASAGAAQAAICDEFKAGCAAGMGTLSNSPCPTTCAVGRCIITASGAAAFGVYNEWIDYSPVTRAESQNTCVSRNNTGGGTAMFLPLNGGGTCPARAGDGGTGSASGSSSGGSGSGSSGGSGGGCATTGSAKASSVSVGGQGYACAVTTGGFAECWGENLYGQLGNACVNISSQFISSVPVLVAGLTSGVTAISCGYASTCALTTGGGVVCWGSDRDGTLGNGATNGTLAPVQVTGLTSGVTAISTGTGFACAVTAGGGVACWGTNTSGQLGNGSTTRSLVPVQVMGLTSGVTAVSSGTTSACAVTAGGGVACWGDNRYGQLGNGNTTSTSVPVPVMGLTSGVTAISVGSGSGTTGGQNAACAITAGGAVVCWGNNTFGELGDGTRISSSVPVQVTGLTSGVIALSCGYTSACALTTGGGVVCWGDNSNGELGNGATTSSSVPVQVTGLTSGVTAISTHSSGDSSACAVTAGGGVVCWGKNTFGELGNGSTASSSVPVHVTGF